MSISATMSARPSAATAAPCPRCAPTIWQPCRWPNCCARNPGLDPAAIEEVWLGCANQAGEDNRNVARMASLLAGLPDRVPGVTVNRLCGSGMEAVVSALRAIKSGEMELAIAGGVESMSRAPFVMLKAGAAPFRARSRWRIPPSAGASSIPECRRFTAPTPCRKPPRTWPTRWQSRREAQDIFALGLAKKGRGRDGMSGRFAQEIIPVTVSAGKGKEFQVTTDEHPRPETTLCRPVAACGPSRGLMAP